MTKKATKPVPTANPAHADADAGQWELVQRLTRDMKAAAKLFSRKELRWLVSYYYSVQDFRIQANNNSIKSAESGQPHTLIAWVYDSMRRLESDMERALDSFSDEYTVGRWLKSLMGVSSIIASGLLAHLDITKAPHAGHFYSFAGLSPHIKWEKGKKRPFNADLKCLLWKTGESFIKVQHNPKDFYGQLYVARKEIEWRNNLMGKFATIATDTLSAKKFGQDTDAYLWYSGQFSPNRFPEYQALESTQRAAFLRKVADPKHNAPMLPPAHIHARARRHTVKLFLSHLHYVMHVDFYGIAPPPPYVLAAPGVDPTGAEHTHFTMPPNYPFGDIGKSLRDLV